MAQSNSFFGLRRGSTKTLTFSVYNGKQVTKDRIYNVKNPRYPMQMKQRAIMATALRGYSALKEICDHSFEGITYGQKSMNYFVSENARMIRNAAPKVNLSLSKGNSVSNAYIISKGSLNGPVIVTGQDSSSHYFSVHMSKSASYTFGSLMAKLGATTPGDMVTFVNLVDNEGADASLYWMRLRLTEENASKALGSISDGAKVLQVLTEGVDFETNIDNFSLNDFPVVVYTGDTFDTLIVGTSQNIEGTHVSESMGVILSRKSDTAWLRSSNTMVNLFDTYNYDKAIASYPESSEKILNGGNM